MTYSQGARRLRRIRNIWTHFGAIVGSHWISEFHGTDWYLSIQHWDIEHSDSG